MAEQNDIDEQVVTGLGHLEKESPSEAAELKNLTSNLREGLAGIMINSSIDQKAQLLKALRGFGNGVYGNAYNAEDNRRHPERVLTALEGAEALVAPEANNENSVGAQKMVDALKQRFSTK